jgi:multiple sugar transport system permease protein
MTDSNLTQGVLSQLVGTKPFGLIRFRIIRWLQYGMLITLAATMLIPFLWMFGTSLKTQEYILETPPQLIPDPVSTESYTDLFDLMPMGRMFMNSVLVAVVGTAGQVLVSAMAAYAFSRLTWRGRDTVFLLYLATLMSPARLFPNMVIAGCAMAHGLPMQWIASVSTRAPDVSTTG